MKVFRILSLLGLVAILLTYSSCGGDDPASESVSDVQLGKLSKTWKVNTVTKDGDDRTAEYSSFQLVLNGTKGNTSFGYSTTGRTFPNVWKSGGSWEFGSSPETQMIRDKGSLDELAMSYIVTETTLKITFNFQKDGYMSRTGVVKGNWEFNFKL